MVIFLKTDRMLISKCTEKAYGLKIKKKNIKIPETKGFGDLVETNGLEPSTSCV